jgi:DNA polymerase-3 subunit epsilon
MADELDGVFGPFASRRAAKTALMDLATEHGLCWSLLGLERRKGPCFARQLARCRGACVGAEAPTEHHARVRAALSPFKIAPWPFAGPIGIRETGGEDGRDELHLIDRWCHLGTARAGHEVAGLLESPPPQGFDLDIYRIISAFLARSGLSVRIFELAQLLAAA